MPLIITANGNITESPLTPRERGILTMLGNGLQPRQVANQLLISEGTVSTHIKNAYKKLGAHNKVEALRKSGLW